MSQLDSDGIEDVVHGQTRLLVGAAGTAMAAAARVITERTRRQREIALAELAAERARAETDRRLLLLRLEMAKTDQWRQETPFEQVAETLYLARLYERTEPAAAASIEDLEELMRTRFDVDPHEVVAERARQVTEQREAETALAVDALERAEGARDQAPQSGPPQAAENAAVITAEQTAPDPQAARSSTSTTAATPDSTGPDQPTGGPAPDAPAGVEGAVSAGAADVADVAAGAADVEPSLGVATASTASAAAGGRDAGDQPGGDLQGGGPDSVTREVDVQALAAQMHAVRAGSAATRPSQNSAGDLAARALQQRRAARARSAAAESATEQTR